MINYEFKAQIIEAGFDRVVKECDKAIFQGIKKEFNPDYTPRFPSSISYESALAIKDEYFYSGKEKYDEWQEAEKINHAKNQRAWRLHDRINSYLEKPCLFLTLTFTDEVFEKTSEETRRTYVARFLKATGCKYVANYDEGEDYGREHYHAILQSGFIEPSTWLYGNLDVERVRRAKDSIKLARYIAELTNHAIKATTRQCRVIYSR